MPETIKPRHVLRRERRNSGRPSNETDQPLEVGTIWRPVITPRPRTYTRSAVKILSVTLTHVYVLNQILGFSRNVPIEEFLENYRWVIGKWHVD